MRVVTTVVAAFLIFSSVAAQASGLGLIFCRRPPQPYLPSAWLADYYAMQSGEQELDRYLSSMKKYVECIVAEVEDAQREADRVLNDWNSTVHQYNLRQ